MIRDELILNQRKIHLSKQNRIFRHEILTRAVHRVKSI